ncbi:Serpin domain-containing protein [Aspergillus varians]
MSTETEKTHRVTDAVNQLGWDVITELCAAGAPPSRVAVSPLSIAFALAMFAGGADETKRDEICSKLRLSNCDDMKEVYGDILRLLKATSDFIPLQAVNALFAESTAGILPSYSEYLNHFGAHVHANLPQLAAYVGPMNEAISQQTTGMIPNLLSHESLTKSHIVVVNAMVYKAPWLAEFDPNNTTKEFFFTYGVTTEVNMMYRHGVRMLIAQRRNYTAVRLPYSCGTHSRWSFIAYLPHLGTSVDDIIPPIRECAIPKWTETPMRTLGIPRFKMQTTEGIMPVLGQLGYPLLGSFPNIGERYTMVDQVIHNVTIIVDEKGTNAATGTAAAMAWTMLEDVPNLVFNRPFAFSIMEDDLKMAVFSGVFLG